MNEIQTISWIFLAIALASQKEAVDLNGISSVADGINHAFPTQKEMKLSIKWLHKSGFINSHERKYFLTEEGKAEFYKATKENDTVLDIWNTLEENFIKL